ncbi:hypothetical protein N9948_00865 [bacterium]|nr:hypothetical protein [bacterium]
MNKEVLTIYGSYQNSDMIEGRGGMVLKELFFDKEEAEKHAKGKGVMGYGDGRVYELAVFRSNEHVELFRDKEYQKQLKENALKKLTAEEKRALNLK